MNHNTPPPSYPTYRYFWRLIRYRPLYYLTDLISITIHLAAFVPAGLILRAFFDSLTGRAQFSLTWLVGAQLIYTLLTGGTLAIALIIFMNFFYQVTALVIRNLTGRILELPGAQPLPLNSDGTPMSTGQAISTLRDDTNEMAWGVALIDDVVAALTGASIAFVIMFSISPWVTLGTFLPLGVVVFVAHRLGKWVKKYRQASREATAQVTGLIADMFHGTEAIKVAGAEQRLMTHFAKLNKKRQNAMVKDKLLSEVVTVLSEGFVQVGVGLVLLIAAQEMYSGSFTVGDFVLFASYIWPLTFMMGLVGDLMTRYQQVGVSTERMGKIMKDSPAGAAVAHHPLYLDGRYPPVPFIPKTPADQLHTLTVKNLSYLYPSSGQGVKNISFTLPRGSLTVITGRIGSGKTTLLKLLLGLIPTSAGELYWNGQLIKDPSLFMVPPRVAYTAQVPRLFSDTLHNNILLGLPEEQVSLSQAIHAAVLEEDLAQMELGLETMVGPRGIRLSGGQLQRSAAARMFVRQPELYIFDDLSSALDVNTEKILWERLLDTPQPPTCLVVSHRRPLLQRADQILVIKEGQIEDSGRLEELLGRGGEIQALWAEETA